MLSWRHFSWATLYIYTQWHLFYADDTNLYRVLQTHFYRAMHYSAKRVLRSHVVCPSVCLSVCDVGGS